MIKSEHSNYFIFNSSSILISRYQRSHDIKFRLRSAPNRIVLALQISRSQISPHAGSIDRQLRGWGRAAINHNTNEEQPQQKSEDMNSMEWKGVE
jgi:hypothetical protein